MDWNQSTMYEQRVRFILEVQQRTFTFAESCRRYGISRTAGYTWWKRFLAEGFEGLHDRSHRPHHCPHAVAVPFVEHIVDLRQRYGWGSRKIRKLTAEKFGSAPARRTIDRIFERHDLITKKRRRSGRQIRAPDSRASLSWRHMPAPATEVHGSLSPNRLRPSNLVSRSRTAVNECIEPSSAKPLDRRRQTSVPSNGLLSFDEALEGFLRDAPTTVLELERALELAAVSPRSDGAG